MHSAPSQGVVDPDLKLNGTSNCFICSNAVFPTGGFSNPTHTLIALTVRLAQHLNQRTAELQNPESVPAVAAEETVDSSR
jgi:choline dehydrogenase-like flavoprotein